MGAQRHLLGVLLLGSSWRAAFAGALDQEYQAWAAKVYDSEDKKGAERGQAVACVFCQILVNAVKKQSQLNKDRPRDERYGEEEVTEVLLELCSTAAPRIAKSLDGYAKDAEMLCRRVVNENAGEMLDAASLGEDLDSFCKDSKLCPFGLEALTKFMSAMADTQNSKKSSPKGEVGQKELKNLVEAMQAMKGEDDDDEL